MIWFDGEELFQDCGGLLAVGEGGVVVGFGGEQGERVEDRGFMIVGVGLVDFFHRSGIGGSAGFVTQFLRIGVKRSDGGDVGFFAGRG